MVIPQFWKRLVVFSLMTCCSYSMDDLDNLEMEERSLDCSLPQDIQLRNAIKVGDIALVKKLLDAGVSVDGKERAMTPLLVAAYYGQDECIEVFLDRGADPKKEFFDQLHPHVVALIENHEKCSDLFSSRGLKVRDFGSKIDKWNPLYLAAAFGDLRRIKKIVSSCDKKIINKSTYYRDITPLFLAVAAGEEECMKFLVKKGADIKVKTWREENLLCYAAYSQRVGVLDYLMKKGLSCEVENWNGWRPLHFVARYGSAPLMSCLLTRNVDITARTKPSGLTALHLAAVNGEVEIMKLLVNKDKKLLTVETHDGTKLICYAATCGSNDCLDYCLDNGLSIEEKDKNGVGPLHYVVLNGTIRDVENLLERHADVNAKTNNGRTPLHLAAQHNKVDIAKVLIAGGANVNARTDEYVTPLHRAAEKGSVQMMKVLVDNDGDIFATAARGLSTIHFAAFGGSVANLTYCLEEKFSIEAESTTGFRPLHCAAQNGRTDAVGFLLNQGADYTAKTFGWLGFGKTVAMVAEYNGYNNIAKLINDHKK